MSIKKSQRRTAPDIAASPPFVGALLRHCWTRVWQNINETLRAEGFTDLPESYVTIFRYPGPDAVRPSDLARRLQVSRQLINHGIAQLEELGYLERRVAPESGRRLVYLTKRGHQVIDTIYASLWQLQKEWERKVGRKRFSDFMDTLRILSAEK
jgi:DNA-binding MarR family transcriptional regulator